MELFTQVILAITNITGMSNGEAEKLVTDYCMNKAYTPKKEIHYELCSDVWDEFNY